MLFVLLYLSFKNNAAVLSDQTKPKQQETEDFKEIEKKKQEKE